MAPLRIPPAASLRRWCRAVVCVVVVAGGGARAHGQATVGPVIEPSPMIARGHLEGGINGEGNPRPDGKTPLMLAVAANDLAVVDYLLTHGADPAWKDAAGQTALTQARLAASSQTAEKLVAYVSAHPDPTGFYAGKNFVLSAVSARAQSASPGCVATHLLVISVADHDGQPLADAPARFVVEGGGKCLLTQPSAPASPSLLLRTDGLGQCRVGVQLPKEPDTRVRITASAGSGDQTQTITFTALTNDGTGGDSTPYYEPTNLQASMSPAGDLDLSWQNNTDDATAIQVSVKEREGWKVVATLPPNATSAHIPAR